MATNERAIRRIEKRRHNVTIRVLVRLALALDVGVQELLAPVEWEKDPATGVRTDGDSERRGRRK
jgi:transcriptional regulator with XRE-family HTH domain